MIHASRINISQRNMIIVLARYAGEKRVVYGRLPKSAKNAGSPGNQASWKLGE